MIFNQNEFSIAPPWFEEWFDSPYYHILYSHRDNEEAAAFLDLMCGQLQLPPGSGILDLGCGKGRHARHLHSKGFKVTGVDLSQQNIDFCRQFEEPGLEFYVHDMRRLFRINYYHAVLNLFTSFGYFEQDHQNELVIQAASKSLLPGGQLVIDFLNAEKVKNEMQPEQIVVRENIEFHIRKNIRSGFLIKDITFDDQGNSFRFREEVRLLSENDFRAYFERAGLLVEKVYGDYKLDSFDIHSSPRLIMVARKNILWS